MHRGKDTMVVRLTVIVLFLQVAAVQAALGKAHLVAHQEPLALALHQA
jgi:hypothetical protein